MNEPLPFKNPVIRAYKTVDELRTLKKWFYQFDEEKDQRRRAIQRVKALASRGKMPHGVEATSFLTSAILADNDTADTNVVQMVYAASFIRFVNGLLDPLQSGHFVIPLVALAQQLGLPFFFVELRHLGTHDLLPTIEMCRIASKKALSWLFDNYWNQIDSDEIEYKEYEIVKFDHLPVENDDIVDQITRKLEPVVGALSSYKKMRKQDLDGAVSTRYVKVFKNLKSFSNSKEKWYLHEINHLTSQDLLMNVLLYRDFLIYNHAKLSKKGSFKFNFAWIKLYQPLLDEMGFRFKLHLTLKIMQQIQAKGRYEDILSKLEFALINPKEVAQLLEWLNHLIPQVLEEYSRNSSLTYLNIQRHSITISSVKANGGVLVKSKDELFQYFATELSKMYNITSKNSSQSTTAEVFTKVVTTCSDYADENNLTQKSKAMIEPLLVRAKYVSDFQKSFVAPPSLEDILGNSAESSVEPVQKKRKGNTFLFEPHTGWQPVPFGVPV